MFSSSAIAPSTDILDHRPQVLGVPIRVSPMASLCTSSPGPWRAVAPWFVSVETCSGDVLAIGIPNNFERFAVG